MKNINFKNLPDISLRMTIDTKLPTLYLKPGSHLRVAKFTYHNVPRKVVVKELWKTKDCRTMLRGWDLPLADYYSMSQIDSAIRTSTLKNFDVSKACSRRS